MNNKKLQITGNLFQIIIFLSFIILAFLTYSNKQYCIPLILGAGIYGRYAFRALKRLINLQFA